MNNYKTTFFFLTKDKRFFKVGVKSNIIYFRMLLLMLLIVVVFSNDYVQK